MASIFIPRTQQRLTGPIIMGILNVTPDSFFDGNRYHDLNRAIDHATRMIDAGAQIIDVGGESTRPYAPAVHEQEELQRVIPVIEALRARFSTPISIDTYKPGVMRQAIDAGADIINDVKALQEPGALATAAELAVPVCLMHMQGTPATMQDAPQYHHLMDEICDFFKARLAACHQAGIDEQQIILDPGLCFGKTLAQSYQLLRELATFKSLGRPILAGVSRKTMIYKTLNTSAQECLIGSVLASSLAVYHGADIIRVHDVAETQQAMTILQAVMAQPAEKIQ